MPSDLKLSVQSVTPDVTLTLSDPYIGSAYSPQVDVSEIEGGHEVTITHKAPSGIVTDTFDVLDGIDGTDGIDGVSPTVEIESTTDTHTITITDADGAHSYTVDTYADEEAARATAESSRVAAESSRVTAEQARASAESSRAAAESARVTAEASRATAEQGRAAAESSRTTAEQARVTAETARATAESARASAESTRVSAEQARATAETARASAESGRVTAEQGRVSAENARATAETARANAETARASAETARATAESARATAESTRATEWATIKTEAQDTISAAETATSDANAAASDATTAAAEARAASAATWLAGNVLFGELEEAAVLTADDVYAAPPKSVEVYGKSTQVVTTGKNLLDIPDVTLTRSAYLYNGPVQIPAGTYTMSGKTPVVNLSFAIVDGDGTTMDDGSYMLPHTFVLPRDAAEIRIYTAVSGTYANIQFEAGATATTYEPYTGGKPSPNPDYPQEIVSVDELVIHANDTRGATWWNQLINPNPRTVTSKGVTFTMAPDGKVTLSGTATGAESFTATAVFPIVSGHKYLCMGGSSSRGVGVAVPDIGLVYAPEIRTASSDVTSTCGVYVAGSFSGTYEFYPQLFDLTLMFGVGNEPSTVTEFTAMFPEPYYPYDPGSWLDSGDWPASIPLSNNVGRSLPDGTRDTLTLSYVGPSTEHEGWGVYSKVLTQRLDTFVVNGSENWQAGSSSYNGNVGTDRFINKAGMVNTGGTNGLHSLMSPVLTSGTTAIWTTPDSYVWQIVRFNGQIHIVFDNATVGITSETTERTALIKAWLAENPITVHYPLLNPVTHDLGTVELPILPNPLTAWADGGSAQTTMQLEYERSLSIVIPRIEAAISDLATS